MTPGRLLHGSGEVVDVHPLRLLRRQLQDNALEESVYLVVEAAVEFILYLVDDTVNNHVTSEDIPGDLAHQRFQDI